MMHIYIVSYQVPVITKDEFIAIAYNLHKLSLPQLPVAGPRDIIERQLLAAYPTLDGAKKGVAQMVLPYSEVDERWDKLNWQPYRSPEPEFPVNNLAFKLRAFTHNELKYTTEVENASNNKISLFERHKVKPDEYHYTEYVIEQVALLDAGEDISEAVEGERSDNTPSGY